MASKAFIHTLITRRDSLFSLIHQFNFGISGYIDQSHIQEPFLKKYWAKIAASSRVRKKLSHYLLLLWGLQDQVHYNFEEPRLRLALLDPKTFERLLVYAGAALYAERIAKIIAKKDVQALMESVGSEVYFFAAKRAPLLYSLRPNVPLVEGNTFTRENFFQAGKQCLEMCFSGESKALLERLKMKFPAEVEWVFRSEADEGKKTKAWNYLHRLLVKEVEPQWKSCFT